MSCRLPGLERTQPRTVVPSASARSMLAWDTASDMGGRGSARACRMTAWPTLWVQPDTAERIPSAITKDSQRAGTADRTITGREATSRGRGGRSQRDQAVAKKVFDLLALARQSAGVGPAHPEELSQELGALRRQLRGNVVADHAPPAVPRTDDGAQPDHQRVGVDRIGRRLVDLAQARVEVTRKRLGRILRPQPGRTRPARVAPPPGFDVVEDAAGDFAVPCDVAKVHVDRLGHADARPRRQQEPVVAGAVRIDRAAVEDRLDDVEA